MVRAFCLKAVLSLALLVTCAPGLFAVDHELRLQLILDDAVAPLQPSGEQLQHKRSAHLLLYLAFRDGVWSSVIGQTPTHNKGHHVGFVESWSWLENRLRLNIRMDIRDDAWVSGGLASYQIDIDQVNPQQLAGTDSTQPVIVGSYRGVFEGISLGEARRVELSALQPGLPSTANRFENVLLGELDQNTLKKRIAHSPVVASAYAYLQEQKHVLAYGLRYQVTGDKKYSKLGSEAFRRLLKSHAPDSDASGVRWAQRARDVAYAMELFGDTFDESLRREGSGYLQWLTTRLLYRYSTLSRALSSSPNGVRNGILGAGAGIAALAHMDEAPQTAEGASPAIRAPSIIAPLAKVPKAIRDIAKQQIPLSDMPEQWMAAGPFPDPANSHQDYLEHLRGSSFFHEQVATDALIRHGRQKAGFQKLNKKYLWEYQGRRTIEFTEFYARNYQEKKQGYHHTAYFYTAFTNKESRRVQLQTRAGGPTLKLWLNGSSLSDGDYVLLEPGVYFLLVRAHISSTNDWGKMWMSPILFPVRKDEMDRVMGRRMARGEIQRQVAVADTQFWQDTTAAAQPWVNYARDANFHMAAFTASAMGQGGWLDMSPDSFADISLPIEYASAYAKRHAAQHTVLDDIESYIKRQVFQTVFTDKHPATISLDGEPGIHAGLIARAWPLIPKRDRPSMLWAWNRYLGLHGNDEVRLSFSGVDDALFTLLHYPTQLKPVRPSPSSQQTGLNFTVPDAVV